MLKLQTITDEERRTGFDNNSKGVDSFVLETLDAYPTALPFSTTDVNTEPNVENSPINDVNPLAVTNEKETRQDVPTILDEDFLNTIKNDLEIGKKKREVADSSTDRIEKLANQLANVTVTPSALPPELEIEELEDIPFVQEIEEDNLLSENISFDEELDPITDVQNTLANSKTLPDANDVPDLDTVINTNNTSKKRRPILLYSAAAAVLLCTTLGGYFWMKSNPATTTAGKTDSTKTADHAQVNEEKHHGEHSDTLNTDSHNSDHVDTTHNQHETSNGSGSEHDVQHTGNEQVKEHDSKTTAHTPEHHENVNTKVNTNSHEVKPEHKDTKLASHQVKPEHKDTKLASHEPKNNQKDSHNNDHQVKENKVKPTEHTSPKKEHGKEPESHSKPVVDNTPKPNKAKEQSTQAKNSNQDLEHNTAVNNQNKNKDEVFPVKMIPKPVPKDVQSSKGVFYVQVYATPSEEDAKDWINRLKSKSISNPFMTNQIIRGEKLYRVRFGSYPTRQEAESAALKLGYASAWIDRVK